MPWKKHGKGYTTKHGGFISNPKQYEKLKEKYGKERAAAITNANMSKRKIDWHNAVLLPIGTGAAGAAIANQVPRAHPKRKKRKDVSKNLSPIIKSDDPNFNYRAARKAVDLVMKMDEDTARAYTEMVVGDLIEDDIEKNRRTLQRHLDHVIHKRIQTLTRALDYTITKRDGDEVRGWIQALEKIEKASYTGAVPHTPQYYGYTWEESDFKRDPSTGRFMTKVKSHAAEPLHHKDAEARGIKHISRQAHGANIDPHDLARYQQEYQQLAQFLGAVKASTTDADVMLHMKDRQGNRYIRHNPSRDPQPWDPTEESLQGIEAIPHGLTAGGAAFGLTSALGQGGHSGEKMANTLNAAFDNGGLKTFGEQWTAKPDNADFSSNARLYNRVNAGSQFLSTVAPRGSHAQLAGKFGELVGSYGPQAEKVLGPPTRRAAYRYRGTEKKPDAELMREYREAVTAAPPEELSEDENRDMRRLQNRRLTEAVDRKWAAMHEGRKVGEEITPRREVHLSQDERARIINDARKEYLDTREKSHGVTEAGIGAGRERIAEYLHSKMPSDKLYMLQLASGHTPPSEGVILDAKGNLVTQAIGYGDDHYLPFNLKNLKGLKGGEYIRTRSVGGPTTEDIYTGLVMGARRLQVESRSGTFVVEFEPDFRGGRRYNDKARRMVKRYGEILDAVQSEQVERTDVDRRTREAITAEVKEEYPGAKMREMRPIIKERIEEYKRDPNIDEDMFESIVQRRTEGMPEAQANRVRAQIRNDMLAEKEFKFRLNGVGYAAGLKALEEQFPYYLHVDSYPRQEEEKAELSPDRGYVEPGHNRPTEAYAGYFGTAARAKGRTSGTGLAFGMAGNEGAMPKGSASRVNYQPGANYYTQAKKPVEEVTEEGAPAEPGAVKGETEADRKHREMQQKIQHLDQVDAMVKLQAAIKNRAEPEDLRGAGNEWLNMDPDEFRRHIQENPANFRQVYDRIQAYKAVPAFMERATRGSELRTALDEFTAATGRIGEVPYNEAAAANPDAKFFFTEPGYKKEDSAAQKAKALEDLNKVLPISSNMRLGQMNDEQLRRELNLSTQVIDLLGGNDQWDLATKQGWLDDRGINHEQPGVLRLLDAGKPGLDKRMAAHMKAVHQMRAYNRVHGRTPGAEDTFTDTGAGGGRRGYETAEPPRLGDMNDQQRRSFVRDEVLRLRNLGNELEAGGDHSAADIVRDHAEEGAQMLTQPHALEVSDVENWATSDTAGRAAERARTSQAEQIDWTRLNAQQARERIANINQQLRQYHAIADEDGKRKAREAITRGADLLEGAMGRRGGLNPADVDAWYKSDEVQDSLSAIRRQSQRRELE